MRVAKAGGGGFDIRLFSFEGGKLMRALSWSCWVLGAVDLLLDEQRMIRATFMGSPTVGILPMRFWKCYPTVVNTVRISND